jgi:hypothetical protein
LRQLAGADRFRFHRDELLAHAYQGGEVYQDDYARRVLRLGSDFFAKSVQTSTLRAPSKSPPAGACL